ncbi:LPS export ABC transporter permease LptF [Fastidiosibacter lacustris]|uniref:LPS export ABC transporter permease LptF n=1 Tax=Fastidiosibacter lacustris TaxID=2056695 RepID=UPI000E34F5A9|nr:LPS export ABC transporter permease LptF [Fastidiosibacter lacustris]
MILLRYLNRELVNMTMAIILILLLIVISNMFVRYLSIVSGGNIEADAVFKMISVMLPKYIAYLLPISFFFSILIVYGKLFANNELTVAFACGTSWFRLFKFILIPALSLFIIEIILTLFILPKMDQNYFLVQKTTTKNSLISFIQPGQIIPFNDGKQVVYTKSTDSDGTMYDIFIYQQKPNNASTIITAPIGYAETRPDGNQYLILKDGYFYDAQAGTAELQKGEFKEATQFISSKVTVGYNSSIESVPTFELLGSNNPLYQAELQWRLSFPLAILVSTLIALAMSKMRPRQNRYSKIIPAILVCIMYFNLLSLSKSWLNDGTIPSWIGLWWIHIIFAVTMLIILKRYNGKLFYYQTAKSEVKV